MSKLNLTCPECGQDFSRYRSHAARVSVNYCSQKCNGKARGRALVAHPKHGLGKVTPEAIAKRAAKMMGSNNPAWKGGRYFKESQGNYQGPAFVRCPADLPTMRRANGYILEHRLVMARMVGRPLSRQEVVHHLNHDTRDNRPANLALYPDNGTHKRMEHGGIVSGAACLWFPRA